MVRPSIGYTRSERIGSLYRVRHALTFDCGAGCVAGDTRTADRRGPRPLRWMNEMDWASVRNGGHAPAGACTHGQDTLAAIEARVARSAARGNSPRVARAD